MAVWLLTQVIFEDRPLRLYNFGRKRLESMGAPDKAAARRRCNWLKAPRELRPKAWLAQQPVGRFEFTFAPKHGSWLNLIEGLFSRLARSVLRHIRVASKDELNRMATYCPRTGRRSAHHLPVSSALWRTGADQTAAQTRRLRIRRLGPTRRLIRELSGMDD
jgi:transposase